MNTVASPKRAKPSGQEHALRAVQISIEKLGSQNLLASRCGVTANMVSQWINRHRPVSSNHARTLSAISGVSLEDMFPELYGPVPSDPAVEPTKAEAA